MIKRMNEDEDLILDPTMNLGLETPFEEENNIFENHNLYKSIMQSVAKTVKQTLNEEFSESDEEDYYRTLLLSKFPVNREMSLYGEYEVEDYDGWCTYELDSIYVNNHMQLIVNYTKIITYHEMHTSDKEYNYKPLDEFSDEIIQSVFEQIIERCS